MNPRQVWCQGWPIMAKGTSSSGWFSPPRGSHVPGARAGDGKLRDVETGELKQELVRARQKVLQATHTLDDVANGKFKAGVEGRGGQDIREAKERGLFTTVVDGIPIFARTEANARPLISYLKGRGKYGTPEFSKLLGYTTEEIKDYKWFLAVQDELRRRGIE